MHVSKPHVCSSCYMEIFLSLIDGDQHDSNDLIDFSLKISMYRFRWRFNRFNHQHYRAV